MTNPVDLEKIKADLALLESEDTIPYIDILVRIVSNMQSLIPEVEQLRKEVIQKQLECELLSLKNENKKIALDIQRKSYTEQQEIILNRDIEIIKLKRCLTRIIEELPVNRYWLDPVLEDTAKELIK